MIFHWPQYTMAFLVLLLAASNITSPTQKPGVRLGCVAVELFIVFVLYCGGFWTGGVMP